MGVSVLLADDHPVFRQGLRALLERERFEILGEASDGLEAIAMAERAIQTAPSLEPGPEEPALVYLKRYCLHEVHS